MSTNPQPPKTKDTGRIWAGVIIIALGSILLSKQLDLNIYFPSWLTSGKMFLIIIGLIVGATSNFKNPVSYILIGLGIILIVKDEFHINLWKIIFPAIMIAVGVWLLTDRSGRLTRLKRKSKINPNAAGWNTNQSTYSSWQQNTSGDADRTENTYAHAGEPETEQNRSDHWNQSRFSDAEFVKSTAIFSEVKKIIVTKDFRGANLVNVFGGTDINLMQTDLSEPVVIEVFQIFAGTKIIVPSNWRVISEVVSVFGEVDDRRFAMGNFKDEHKVVYLRGTSLFGGITIKSM